MTTVLFVEEVSPEFPKGKEPYCPRCYFERDVKLLRKDCPHNDKK